MSTIVFIYSTSLLCLVLTATLMSVALMSYLVVVVNGVVVMV